MTPRHLAQGNSVITRDTCDNVKRAEFRGENPPGGRRGMIWLILASSSSCKYYEYKLDSMNYRLFRRQGRLHSDADGGFYSAVSWWIVTFPGLAITITVMATNLVGDWLRNYLDPRFKAR